MYGECPNCRTIDAPNTTREKRLDGITICGKCNVPIDTKLWEQHQRNMRPVEHKTLEFTRRTYTQLKMRVAEGKIERATMEWYIYLDARDTLRCIDPEFTD